MEKALHRAEEIVYAEEERNILKEMCNFVLAALPQSIFLCTLSWRLNIHENNQ